MDILIKLPSIGVDVTPALLIEFALHGLRFLFSRLTLRENGSKFLKVYILLRYCVKISIRFWVV